MIVRRGAAVLRQQQRGGKKQQCMQQQAYALLTASRPPFYPLTSSSTSRGRVVLLRCRWQHTSSNNNKESFSSAPFEYLFNRLVDPPSSESLSVTDRPQTAWERLKNFPEGVKGLLRDALVYKHIQDASKTPLNAWTVPHPFSTWKSNGVKIRHDESSSPSATKTPTPRIPRRQFQEQRMLRIDLGTMFPLIVIWIPPIIGFLPPILAIVAPRQFLSRHFHNPYERKAFARVQYEQMKASYVLVGDDFWKGLSDNCPHQVLLNMENKDDDDDDEDHGASSLSSSSSSSSSSSIVTDAAGPRVDALALYSVFDDTDGKTPWFCMEHKNNNNNNNTMTHAHLVHLALAAGYSQHLPRWMSTPLVHLTPSFTLKNQIRRMGTVVCQDDALLLEEGNDENQCHNLSDQEVMDACLMRGLPVGTSAKAMQTSRECLTGHLQMIRSVRHGNLDPDAITDGLRLFTLHLAPLRYHLEKQLMSMQKKANVETLEG